MIEASDIEMIHDIPGGIAIKARGAYLDTESSVKRIETTLEFDREAAQRIVDAFQVILKATKR